MNEYYKKRFNISNYFLNINSDNYSNNLYIINIIIFIILLILTISPIIYYIIYKTINITLIIFIIFLGLFYYFSYKLLITLNNIQSNEVILNYSSYYNLLNTIFTENLSILKSKFKISNPDKEYISIDDSLLKNINNIENIYGLKADNFKSNCKDILKYYTHNSRTEKENNIENIYTTRLYINFKDFNYLHQNLKFITKDETRIDLSIDNSYVDLKILEDYYKNSIEKNNLLIYINKKYNTNFNVLYRPSIFTSKFDKKLEDVLNNIKSNIYNFIYISIILLLFILQNILYDINIILVNIYIAIIVLLILFMYYYTNT